MSLIICLFKWHPLSTNWFNLLANSENSYEFSCACKQISKDFSLSGNKISCLQLLVSSKVISSDIIKWSEFSLHYST